MSFEFKITKSEMTYLEGVFSALSDCMNSTISVKDNMINFYLKRFPDTTKNDAEKIVDKIINGIATFTKNYEEFQATEDEFIAQKLEEATKNLTMEQKYECLANLLIAIKSVDCELLVDMLGEEDINVLQKFNELKNGSLNITPGTVTQEMLDELLKLTKEAIDNSAISITGNKEIADLIKELPENPEAIEQFAYSHWSEMEYKNYVTLAAYIAYQEGGTPSIQAGVDPEMFAAGIAAGLERDKLIRKASLGQITWEYARKALKFIGGALLIGFLAWTAFQIVTGIIAFSAMVFVSAFNGALLAMIAGMVVGGIIAYHLMDTILKVGEKVVVVAGKGFDLTMDMIAKAYLSVSEVIKKTVLPGVKSGIAFLWKFINEKILQGIFKFNTQKVEPSPNVEVNVG